MAQKIFTLTQEHHMRLQEYAQSKQKKIIHLGGDNFQEHYEIYPEGFKVSSIGIVIYNGEDFGRLDFYKQNVNGNNARIYADSNEMVICSFLELNDICGNGKES